jgi:hypothetical protein
MNPSRPRGARFWRSGLVLCLAGAAFQLAGCSDTPTGGESGSRDPRGPRYVDSFQLEGVDATACQYGGEYPNCKPKPIDDGSAGVAPTPSSDPAAPGSGGAGTSGAYSPPVKPGDDVPPDTTLPTCSEPRSDKEAAWCAGYVPTGEFLLRLQGALARMESRGATCAALAAKARSMLAAGRLRITDLNGNQLSWSAATPVGGDWTIINHVWFDLWGADGVSLDFVISHEMDHALAHVQAGVTDSAGHLLKANGSVDFGFTLNSSRCAGL